MILSVDYIRSLCFSFKTFEKGDNYYLDNKVKNIILDGNSVYAKVQGTYLYDLFLSFDSQGYLISHSCNCAAHSTYSGVCKHVVAVLFKMKHEHIKPKTMSAKKIVSKINRLYCPDCGCVFDETLGKCPECACPVSYIKGVK